MIELTPEQTMAVDIVKDSLWTRKPAVHIGGAAGTGKTSLIKPLCHELGLRLKAPMMITGEDDDYVCVVAPTNKAAKVLRSKGLPASTIHQLYYKVTYTKEQTEQLAKVQDTIRELQAEAIESSDAAQSRLARKIATARALERELDRPKFIFDPELARRARLVICDEASMVGGSILDEMMSVETPVAFFGDYFQLPPVKDEEWFTPEVLDFSLKEIHRQAEGSSILDMANRIREGQPLKGLVNDGSLVTYVDTLGSQPWEDVEPPLPIITDTHKTRNAIARLVRHHDKRELPLPMDGDLLLAIDNDRKRGVYKSTLVEVFDVSFNGDKMYCERVVKWPSGEVLVDSPDVMVSKIGDLFHKMEPEQNFDRWCRKNEDRLPMATADVISRAAGTFKPFEFDWGYAITAHAAQGSEYPECSLMPGRFRGHRTCQVTKRRWLYTAITRCKSKLTLWGNVPAAVRAQYVSAA